MQCELDVIHLALSKNNDSLEVFKKKSSTYTGDDLIFLRRKENGKGN